MLTVDTLRRLSYSDPTAYLTGLVRVGQAELLATGTLTWLASQRHTDRWGHVAIMDPTGKIVFDEAKVQPLVGRQGRLCARVLYQSPLVKYNSPKFTIQMAEADELVWLCKKVGKFFVEKVPPFKDPSVFWGPYVGIKPRSRRTEHWLDVQALRLVDYAQVELYFVWKE